MIRSALVSRVNSHSNPNFLNSTVPTRENIDRLLEMGFTEENAKAALTRTRNDLSTAIELIMDNQLINPEALNDDFRMNANNSNILTNMPNNNHINNSNNNDVIISNSGIVRNETLHNNIDSLERIPNINNLSEFTNEDNRRNNLRTYDTRVNEISNHLNFNESNNNRNLNFNFEFENNESDSLRLFEGLESYDVSFRYAPIIRANRNSFVNLNGIQHSPRISGWQLRRHDQINRSAFIRPETSELNYILDPMGINPQNLINNHNNDNSNLNLNNNNIINNLNNNLDENYLNNDNFVNNQILNPSLINNNNFYRFDQNQENLNSEFDTYYNEIINVVDENSNNRAQNINNNEERNTNTINIEFSSIFPENQNNITNTQTSITFIF